MLQVLVGLIILVASIGGLWFSRAVDGKVKPFARDGRDVYLAIAITVGVGIGISFLVSGVVTLNEP
jgi:hypothetical protein